MVFEMLIGTDMMYEKYISTKRTELNRIAQDRIKKFPDFRVLEFRELHFKKSRKS